METGRQPTKRAERRRLVRCHRRPERRQHVCRRPRRTAANAIDARDNKGPGHSRATARTPTRRTPPHPRVWNRDRALRRSATIARSSPQPEGDTRAASRAQASPTEQRAAGFPGTSADIRVEVVRRLNDSANYRKRFGKAFPDVAAGAPITYDHLSTAITEFEFTLIFANAPVDRFARGERGAMTKGEKRGALLFFGKAGCVQCHQVDGQSNEMFSDFKQHVIGVPQVVPLIGNVPFDGPGANEDFGLEQVTGNPADRYLFRTAPLRNAAVMPAFMHNGAFVRLEDAIRHHLDPATSARNYSPAALPADLQGAPGPIEPVLARLDQLLQTPTVLTDEEFADLVEFRHGLPTRLSSLSA
ncbi:MAG: hypothetical protein IPF82_11105 [Blastocatellia bacterium]|nr:hypothetical protein [Blastocatellia bacterium]